MRLLHFALLYCILSIFPHDTAFEFPQPSRTATTEAVTFVPNTADIEPAANIILQSKDQGQTWQDISSGLPENQEPESFFAGGSDLYLLVNNAMYRTNANLNIPAWEKENVADPNNVAIASSRSGDIAFSHEGHIYKKTPSTETWLPIHTNFRRPSIRTIFETSDGTLFIGCDNGLYRSADKGKSWKQVQEGGWAMDIAESDGVLIGTGQRGIMRSEDNGEHWNWVISEGGVGIAVERIDGGFAAIAYNTTTRSRRIHVSMDQGKTWKTIDEGLPVSSAISSVKQIGKYIVCGHPQGIFRSSDMGKTWNIVHSDNTVFNLSANRLNNGKVFKLYVSGKTLYAVARNAGC